MKIKRRYADFHFLIKMLNVIMLSVAMINVAMLSVVAPFYTVVKNLR